MCPSNRVFRFSQLGMVPCDPRSLRSVILHPQTAWCIRSCATEAALRGTIAKFTSHQDDWTAIIRCYELFHLDAQEERVMNIFLPTLVRG